MGKLIIEACSQSNKMKVFHKIDVFPLTIGRSFDNTLIADDPYISDVHLRIEEGDQDGQWQISDCQSDNGSFLANGRRITEEISICSGDSISMGDSSFRFFTPQHAVEAPLTWHPVPAWVKKVGQPLIAWSIFLLFAAIAMLNYYLETFSDFEPSEFAMAAMGILFLVLLWVGVWSLVGKVTTHSAGFHRQLAIMLLATLVTELGVAVVAYLEFFTSNRLLGQILNYGLSISVLSLTLFYSLGVATNMVKKRRILASSVVSALLLGLIVASQIYEKKLIPNSQPEFSSVLKSLPVEFLPANDPEGFWQDNIRLVNEEASPTFAANEVSGE